MKQVYCVDVAYAKANGDRDHSSANLYVFLLHGIYTHDKYILDVSGCEGHSDKFLVDGEKFINESCHPKICLNGSVHEIPPCKSLLYTVNFLNVTKFVGLWMLALLRHSV